MKATFCSVILLGAWLLASSDARAVETLPPPAPINAPLAELGRQLFFEPRLSGDGSRSCANCHIPERGYTDGLALSRGYNGTEYFRNVPGLLSLRLKTRFMWDGRSSDLESAVREMVLDAAFMNGNAGVIAERIIQVPQLLSLWQAAYGANARPRGEHAFAALAEFLRGLDFGRSAVDHYLAGDAAAMPPQAIEGLRLFSGKARCTQCHAGPLFTDGRSHRLDVPEHPAILRDPLRTVSLLRHHALRGTPHPMSLRSDLGAYAVSKNPSDRGAFLTPSLRGLAQSGPYMHNGRFATLEQVIDFYDRGAGPASGLPPLRLDLQERKALRAFLLALSAPPPVAREPLGHNYSTVAGTRR